MTSRDAFVGQIRERGEYAEIQEAENVAKIVLALLGERLVGAERTDLAAQLPATSAALLLDAPPAEPVDPEEFVRAAASWIPGATEQTALWDVSAVLSTVADAAGDDLMRRILLQLPPGFAPLFGRTEPD